jgi:hypothetical protein
MATDQDHDTANALAVDDLMFKPGQPADAVKRVFAASCDAGR